ncbi:ribose-phosphate diphosphokinase [Candidatus Magnetomonas plexicatena]|uniref:ribose-phosphate diphosphokinase n=1 Tax=Candidatus Magnetomonas plexicatena TaxID=2552947 RepID=UPI001C78779D|nr:ribose-phosphate pyrophosphokinase [Nitrospirales bacterium LBB_01]
MLKEIKIITGNSNRQLSADVAEFLKVGLTDTIVKTFGDGEISVQVNENVRGHDVFVIQSMCSPVNNNLMELLLIVDALKRASAGRITAVIPYFGYARQDRKVQPRVPISSKLVADLITVAGCHRVLTIDLHAGQIQGFFNIPVDHLYAIPVLLSYIRENLPVKNLTIVSPDAGGVERARSFARRLKCSLAIIDKRRENANECTAENVIGEVQGKDVLILDDMIDTAGTTVQAASILKYNGALNVYAACSHAVLSGPAIERINNSVIEQVITTNTIPINGKTDKCPKLVVLSVAVLMGEAIRRIYEESSISSLFV